MRTLRVSPQPKVRGGRARWRRSPEFTAYLGECAFIPSGQYNPRAFGCKTLRNRAADPTAGAGDNRNFVGKAAGRGHRVQYVMGLQRLCSAVSRGQGLLIGSNATALALRLVPVESCSRGNTEYGSSEFAELPLVSYSSPTLPLRAAAQAAHTRAQILPGMRAVLCRDSPATMRQPFESPPPREP